MAKDALGGKYGSQGSKIPDLPKAIADQLEAAVAAEDKRQQALDDLYDHLFGNGLIDNVETFAYSDTKAYYGLTEVVNMEDAESPMKVTISSEAFKAGAAVVYSTVRHELIHAEQQRLVPDEELKEGDWFFYSDEMNLEGTIGLVQHAMHEIETYAWEIEHAAETGVAKEYVQNRYLALDAYYKDLCGYAEKLGKNQKKRWGVYVKKAKKMAEKLLVGTVRKTPLAVSWLT